MIMMIIIITIKADLDMVNLLILDLNVFIGWHYQGNRA